MPTSWADDTIWWHAFPLCFTGAERALADAPDEPQPRLRQLLSWTDYVVELGANGLLLGPVFRSGTHGYDTIDHYQIDPRLGTTDDLTKLISECVGKGIRVVLDGVFNHVSREHEIVKRALAGGPGSPEGAWIKWVDSYPRVFEGNEPLVELNLENPMVVEYVIGILMYWLDLGIDGWRLDAAYAPGADAWRPIVDGVKARRPDAWFLGEVIHGDYADFVTKSGVDTVTQYELWKAIWSSIDDANFFELAHALKRHAEMCETFVPYTFLGNHDTTRIATKVTDDRHLGHAIALLALLPGTPAVYSGDEQGFTGEKTDGEHGDDAVRPTFPATPAELLPFGASTLEVYQRLIGLRRRHPWLTRASVSTRELSNEFVIVELTSDDERLDVALNLADTAAALPLGEVLTVSSVGIDAVPAHGWAVVKP